MIYLYHNHRKVWIVIYHFTTKLRLKELWKSASTSPMQVLLLDEDTDYGSDLKLSLVPLIPPSGTFTPQCVTVLYFGVFGRGVRGWLGNR